MSVLTQRKKQMKHRGASLFEEFVDDLAMTSMARLWDVGKSEPIKAILLRARGSCKLWTLGLRLQVQDERSWVDVLTIAEVSNADPQF